MSLSFPQCGRACTGYICEFFHNLFDALSCLGIYIWLPIEDTRNSCRRNPRTFGDIANSNSHSSPYTKTYSPSGERFLLIAHCNRCRNRLRHRLHKVYLPNVLLSRTVLTLMVVDNSDFSPTRLTARETPLNLASQESSPCCPF